MREFLLLLPAEDRGKGECLMSCKRTNSELFLLILMGILSAFGPFVTDFYLPAFPSISSFFKASVSSVQLSLTAGMLGLGVGQLFIGPVSDKYGRRPALLGSLILFIIASVSCLFVPSIEWFIFFRFIQGVGGSGGVVISKSVTADLYEGPKLTKFFSMLMVVNGFGPIGAPVIGGLMMKFTDWKGIFVILVLLGLLLFIFSLMLCESLARDKRMKGTVLSSFRLFGPIFKKKNFMLFVVAQSFSMGLLFSYISSSPFILQQHYHLEPVIYSCCFALNAFGIMLGSLLVRWVSERNTLLIGSSGLVICSLALVVVLLNAGNIILLEICFFLLMLFLGMILPTTSSLALNQITENKGSASAILGFLPFVTGSVVSPLVGIGNMIYSTSFMLFLCSLLTLLFTLMGLRRVKVNSGNL